MILINTTKNVTAYFFILKNLEILCKLTNNSFLKIGGESTIYEVNGIAHPKFIYDNKLYYHFRNIGDTTEVLKGLNIADMNEIELHFPKSLLFKNNILYDGTGSQTSIGVNKKHMLSFKSDDKVNTIQYNFDKKNIEWTTFWHFKPKAYYANTYIGFNGRDKSQLLCISEADGKELWVYNCRDLGTFINHFNERTETKVSRALGIYNKKAYIYLNSGKILVLNAETGEQLSILDNHIYKELGGNGNFDIHILLDENLGKFIQVYDNDYTEIDLNTHELTHRKVESLVSKNLRNVGQFAFDKEHIYFSDRDQGKMVALNRLTFEIDWLYDLNEEDDTSKSIKHARSIKVKDNRICFVDSGNTLYVFEK